MLCFRQTHLDAATIIRWLVDAYDAAHASWTTAPRRRTLLLQASHDNLVDARGHTEYWRRANADRD